MRFRKILFPTDFSDCSRLAVPYLEDFASTFGSEVHCLYVVEDAAQYWTTMGPEALPIGPVPAEIMELAEQRMGEFIASHLSGLGKPAIPGVALGRSFAEICGYAQKNGIDLIVMATHGHGALAHLLLGSTAERVVREAPCPVMTIREKKPKA